MQKNRGGETEMKKSKIQKIFCWLGFHIWSKNYGGARICLVCDKFDRYFSITGMLRRMEEERELISYFKKKAFGGKSESGY